MAIDLDGFRGIITSIEDILAMVDRPNISISTDFVSAPDEEEDCDSSEKLSEYLVLKLSFQLKHGSAIVLLGKWDGYKWAYGVIDYVNTSTLEKQRIRFDNDKVYFWKALRKTVIFDRNSCIEEDKPRQECQVNELDLLRSELSKIN
jgi:hypothetical protein